MTKGEAFFGTAKLTKPSDYYITANESEPSSGNEMKKGPVYFFGLLLLILTLLALIFAKFNISYLDSAKFYLALFLGVYIPGQSFCWLLKLKVPRLEMLTLSLIAGMTLSTLVYRISGILRLPPLFFFWLGISSCFFFYRLINNKSLRICCT